MNKSTPQNNINNTQKNRKPKVKKTRISKLAQCIRKTAQTAKLSRTLMPDSPLFDKTAITPGLSAKFTRLIEQIKKLDEADLKTHNKLYKHFIFTDIRESAYGAKAVAAFLMSAGFDLRMGKVEKQMKRKGKIVQTKSGDTIYIPAEPVPGGSNGFAVLQSLPLWSNPLSVQTKKTILSAFNSRPDNIHGELLRIIVLDSKYKEGIDLFDVKYVHLLEPAIATSDLKQAVGRATRYCGQKGLPFEPRSGWRLNVFIYNTVLSNREPFILSNTAKDHTTVAAHNLMLEKSGLDLALINLTQEITILAIQSAVDYGLNYNINNFDIEKALLEETSQSPASFPPPLPESMTAFEKYRWPKPVVKNGCELAQVKGKAVVFSKTQDFIRHYLTPSRPIKGLLAWHSVGTGKTCMAVAAATTMFEQAGYTILWVTRNALMADVYKNIFGSVCAIPFMKEGTVFPDDPRKQKRLLSKAWLPPISYRTFQNALEKKNELGRMLYKKNPTDPLYKTFLVIDEIHKLQDGDLSAAEAADFYTIQKFIHQSYQLSDKNSVRPLLMTATPITDSPKELFEILNTLIPDPANRFDTLDAFRSKFSDVDGTITEAGKKYYQTRAKGIVSYLNREFDPTTFVQPKFQTIAVQLTDPGAKEINMFIDRYMRQIGLDSLISEEIKEKDCEAGLQSILKDIIDKITELEESLTYETSPAAKQKLRTQISDLKQKMRDEEWRYKTRRQKCMKTNKELAKAEIDTRKATLTELINNMSKAYTTQAKLGGKEQLKEIEKCFDYKGTASDEFMKIANERFFPTPKTNNHDSRNSS
jgi:hypothetical protein